MNDFWELILACVNFVLFSVLIKNQLMKKTEEKMDISSVPTNEYLKQEQNNLHNDISLVNRNSRIKIFKPTHYHQVESIAQEMENGKVVIVHFNELHESIQEKTLQFLFGLSYAFNIEPEMVNDNVFMFDPDHKRKNA